MSFALTAGLDVAQVDLNLRVQGKAPGCLLLTSWVSAEVVTLREVRVILGHIVTVRVLSAPPLAVMARFSGADYALVFLSIPSVAALVCGGI